MTQSFQVGDYVRFIREDDPDHFPGTLEVVAVIRSGATVQDGETSSGSDFIAAQDLVVLGAGMGWGMVTSGRSYLLAANRFELVMDEED